ncbi:thiamine phosphate synthase [Aeromicrobium choanae]|uniref:Thiamine-phosphate synthase n=1 Tax=Aeromicrobium choanae TaxID=1736691 RepID=A0A1T4Z6I2_9ACTN|nr:thiamine phosphate synthase [Aeromicrobium choanae]SKB09478.1 thiamine-phosphate diphosphorylase [Aeromicrobium choanae]
MTDLSVYLVTDSGLAASRGRDLAETVAEAVAGGVTTVQVREKDVPAARFLATVLAVSDVLPDDVALIVNDRVDVFLAARAAGARVTGVHVGQSDLPPSLVRQLVGDDAVIGVSAATLAELSAAAADPGRVDYVGVGVVRQTATKTDAPPPLGVEGFAELARSTELPAVAIGGITVADLGPLRAAGAAGAAVVSGICAAEDPRRAATEFAAAWGGAA